MKLAIIGSRDFDDFKSALEIFQKEFPNSVEEIVSGGARGVDFIGKLIAQKFNIKYKEFPADWNKFGKSAGFRRNKEIVDYSDKFLVFWDGRSKGTKNSLDLAKNQNKEIILYQF